LKDKLLYPYAMTEVIRWADPDHAQFLASGSDAVVMWVSGLGSTQTTPGTSTQAAPAPRVDCNIQVMTLSAWLELLTNHLTERCYEC
jgi:hypothetical protein